MGKQLFSEGAVRVKICGLTRYDDASAAIDAGADALGFNFWPGSRRALNADKDLDWIARLPDTVSRVAVVVNASRELLARLKASGIFDAVQFHGDEKPADCLRAGWPCWIRALRAESPAALAAGMEYATSWLLVDAAGEPGVYGGTGKMADSSLVGGFVRAHPQKSILLAGGLTPENVAECVRRIRPYGVDVASGVESSPGRKDAGRMRAFVNEVRSVQART